MRVLLTFGSTDEPDVPRTLQHALAADPAMGLPIAIYVLGREAIALSSGVAGMRPWRDRPYALSHRNAVRYLRLPRDPLIEVGAIFEM